MDTFRYVVAVLFVISLPHHRLLWTVPRLRAWMPAATWLATRKLPVSRIEKCYKLAQEERTRWQRRAS